MFLATVILGGGTQIKERGGRPGPAVIRAICPQPTRGMELTNSLTMTYPSPCQLTRVLGASPLWGGGQGCHEAWLVSPHPPIIGPQRPSPAPLGDAPQLGPCEVG